jgi:hypothetical protein
VAVTGGVFAAEATNLPRRMLAEEPASSFPVGKAADKALKRRSILALSLRAIGPYHAVRDAVARMWGNVIRRAGVT